MATLAQMARALADEPPLIRGVRHHRAVRGGFGRQLVGPLSSLLSFGIFHDRSRSGGSWAAGWATVSSPFTGSKATLALKAGLCFLRCFDISHSFLTATAAFSVGAGLSFSHPVCCRCLADRPICRAGESMIVPPAQCVLLEWRLNPA